MKRLVAIAAILLLAWAVWPERPTVVADRPTLEIELAPDQEMEIAFDLTNLRSVPVRIVGADCACPRLCAKDLPFTIPPGESAPFKVTFHAPNVAGEFKETFNVFIDGPDEPIQLTVVGQIK